LGIVVPMRGLTLVFLPCMYYLPFQPHLRHLVETFPTKRLQHISHRLWRPRLTTHRLALTHLYRRCFINKHLFIPLGILTLFPIRLLCSHIK
jgi:hypothetical protein